MEKTNTKGRLIMVEVTFKYKDQYSRRNWHTQTGVGPDVQAVKDWYGLDKDPDCEYKILSVREITQN